MKKLGKLVFTEIKLKKDHDFLMLMTEAQDLLQQYCESYKCEWSKAGSKKGASHD